MRDLDIDAEEFVDVNFMNDIKGITSDIIVNKISYPNSLSVFKFNLILTNMQVNIARFMMEGMGFSPKYWLCTGVDTLNIIIKYNMEDTHYNELIKVSGRKDVLCLHGLPLFYSTKNDLGDCLLMVSDVKERKVKISCFNHEAKTQNKADAKSTSKKPSVYYKKRKKTPSEIQAINIESSWTHTHTEQIAADADNDDAPPF